MSANGLTRGQTAAVKVAAEYQRQLLAKEDLLQRAVKEARKRNVPILYLADALGVSRSRIRVLARPAQGEHE